MSLDTDAVRFATASAYTDWLALLMGEHLDQMDEARSARVTASQSDRERFDRIVRTITADSVVQATCGLREHLSTHPVGQLGDYDGYDINAVRCALDDAVRAMLAADLRQADQLLGRCIDKFGAILARKRESVSPNRRITAMQRRVITDLRDEVTQVRLELTRLIARVGEAS